MNRSRTVEAEMNDPEMSRETLVRIAQECSDHLAPEWVLMRLPRPGIGDHLRYMVGQGWLFRMEEDRRKRARSRTVDVSYRLSPAGRVEFGFE